MKNLADKMRQRANEIVNEEKEEKKRKKEKDGEEKRKMQKKVDKTYNRLQDERMKRIPKGIEQAVVEESRG